MNQPTTSQFNRAKQRWGWWPVLPTFPYGVRKSLFVELVPGRVWSVEQLHGIWYVAVPIRMTILRLDEGGLLLYSPLPPTAEVLDYIKILEKCHGCVKTIVLATSSGLEHKVSLPALARAFPAAQVWLSPNQWSFPFNLPAAWLGIPGERTRILFEQGLPHSEELHWISLGPLDLGLGTFQEVSCYQPSSSVLLLTDSLVSIPSTPPAIFDLDPMPLLFHAKDCGSDCLLDSPDQRMKGWKRIVLFANYLRPASLAVRSLLNMLQEMLKTQDRSAANHFGFFPFLWPQNWEAELDALKAADSISIGLAPVLERLVFVRARGSFVTWLRTLAATADHFTVIPAHYSAPIAVSSQHFCDLADHLESRHWAPDQGSWQTLAMIDHVLLRFGLVPTASETQEIDANI